MFLSNITTKNVYALRSSHACYMLHQIHPSCFDDSSGSGEGNIRDSGYIKDWSCRPLWGLPSLWSPVFLNFRYELAVRGWGVGVVPWLIYRRGNMSPYSLDMRLVGPQRTSGRGAETKNRLHLPFLRSSEPWRCHQIDGAAWIFELHRISFFVIKWKTFRSVGVPLRVGTHLWRYRVS